MRSVWALALCAVAAVAMAAPVKTVFKIAGNVIGENTYDEQADGSFTSHSLVKIGPTEIDTLMSGQWEKGKIYKFELSQTTSGKKGDVAFDHGKITAHGPDGKAVKIPDSTFTGGAIFSTFHPQLWRSMLPLPTDGKKLSVFLADNLAAMELPFTVSSPRDLNGEKLPTFTYEVAGIKIEVTTKPDGHLVGFNVPVQKFSGIVPGYEGLLVDPMSKFPELSQATNQTSKLLGLNVLMRDGTKLATDIVHPKGDGKYPAILVRTPYGRASDTLQGEWWAQRGYVYVTQDVRGRGDSDGDWDPLVNERKDGADTIAWIAKQPWSDGKVGMIGGSYLGYVQWAAAIETPPALKCIIPQVSPPPPFYNLPWENGAFFLMPGTWWTNIVKAKQADMRGVNQINNAKFFTTLPISKVDDKVLGQDVPFFNRWIERDTPAKWTGATTLPEIAKVKIPVLHISGTWDGDGVGTKLHWETLRAAGKTNQWLIFGPWEHGFNVKTHHAGEEYGQDSLIDLDSVYLRYFDTFLKGKSVNWGATPKVRLFLTGANKWVTLNDWPAKTWNAETLYLYSKGSANGKSKTGSLLPRAIANPPSTYTYDPASKKSADTVQVMGAEGSSILPEASKKADQLWFRSASFAEPRTIAGSVAVTLYISTTARDATFHAFILDEDAAGADRLVGIMGTTRATFADGTGIPKKLVPGKIYKVTIRPWWFAREFAKGHRLAIMVTSDLFPVFARNPGTGEPDSTATRLVKAVQTIYHDAKHPSSVTFEVVKG